jgi:hypothetical protein
MSKNGQASDAADRAKDKCNTCWRKPLCPLRMKGDFHIAECTRYFNDKTDDHRQAKGPA